MFGFCNFGLVKPNIPFATRPNAKSEESESRRAGEGRHREQRGGERGGGLGRFLRQEVSSLLAVLLHSGFGACSQGPGQLGGVAPGEVEGRCLWSGSREGLVLP